MEENKKWSITPLIRTFAVILVLGGIALGAMAFTSSETAIDNVAVFDDDREDPDKPFFGRGGFRGFPGHGHGGFGFGGELDYDSYLAEALGIDEAIIPLNGGIFSAFGMLVAPSERQLTRTLRGDLAEFTKEAVHEAIEKLVLQGKKELLEEGINEDVIETTAQLDLRYKGQSFTLKVDWLNDLSVAEETFHSVHKKRYGHQMNRPVELVNIHAGVQAKTSYIFKPYDAQSSRPSSHPSSQAEKQAIGTTGMEKANLYGIEETVPVIDRKQLVPGQNLQGPALISDSISTTWLEAGWNLRVDVNLNLLLSLHKIDA